MATTMKVPAAPMCLGVLKDGVLLGVMRSKKSGDAKKASQQLILRDATDGYSNRTFLRLQP